MAPSVLLLGGTDVTLAVAEAILDCGAELCAIGSVGDSFTISYSDTRITNARRTDLEDWASRHGVGFIPFSGYDDLLSRVSGKSPQLCLVAGWYHMVPLRVRSLFPRGCYGFHASLLPQLRGGAPLNWAILSGLEETGVTLFEMTDGVDDGLVFGQARFAVGPRSTIAELAAASRHACAALTRRCLPSLLSGTASGALQDGQVSYGLQRVPADGRIDWRDDATSIDRLVRAVGRPYGGAFTTLGGRSIRIWATTLPTQPPQVLGAPGQIARLPGFTGPCVVTGGGLIEIVEASDDDGGSQLETLRRSGHKRFDM